MKHIYFFSIVLSTILVSVLSGCSGKKPDIVHSGFNVDFLEKSRKEKDEEFKGDYSPLSAEERESFQGLHYYPPAEQYAVHATLKVYDHPDTVQIQTTKGDVRRMIRYGLFTFTLEGLSCSLNAYKLTGMDAQVHPNLLSVLFKDETNGKETYEVGRYLDVEEAPGTTKYILDFNQAYNPYCAYSDRYSCPLVPLQNALPVAVRAGEKMYRNH